MGADRSVLCNASRVTRHFPLVLSCLALLASFAVLIQIDIPLAALKRRASFRQISLAPVGRSAALLIGSLDADGTLTLSVTAATVRPIRLSFPTPPDASALRAAIEQQITDELYHADIHGKPLWRKHMTLRLAEEIRGELLDTTRP